MKLLVLAHDLPPSLSPRSIQVGRFLSYIADKHEIYLATSTYRTANRCNVYENVQKLCKGGVVSEQAIWDSSFLKIGMRVAPFLFHIPDPNRWDMKGLGQKIFSKWPDEKFDAIVTFACPFSSHLLGRKLKKHYGCPWVAHFSDPWADNPLAEYGSFSAKINKDMERAVFEEADRIVFVSEEAREFYLLRYRNFEAKMKVVEHSFDYKIYPPYPSSTPNVLTFRFLGNLYGGRSIENLLKAFFRVRFLAENALVRWKLDMVLSYQRSLNSLIKTYELQNNVVVRDSVDYLQSINLMKSADVLVNIDAPWPELLGDNPFFPSKLVDYVGSGRAIFGLCGPGASRRVIERYGGWVADPNDEEDVKRCVQQIFTSWRDHSLKSFTPKPEGRDPYAIGVKADEFLRCLSFN